MLRGYGTGVLPQYARWRAAYDRSAYRTSNNVTSRNVGVSIGEMECKSLVKDNVGFVQFNSVHKKCSITNKLKMVDLGAWLPIVLQLDKERDSWVYYVVFVMEIECLLTHEL